MGLDEAEVDKRVHEAAEFVGLDEALLERSPFELSGGQKRRVAVAGVMAMKPRILVLDEPTAALDPIAENDIYQKYSDMTAGKTSVFISHRLASTRFCDRILFIADGGIAEEGTHKELLAKGGAYAELFAVQSRYYQEGGVQDEEES